MVVESESYDLVVFVQPVVTSKKKRISPSNLSCDTAWPLKNNSFDVICSR